MFVSNRQQPARREQEIIKVDLDAIKKKKGGDVPLQAYDVIDVPEESALFWKGILRMLTNGLSVLGPQPFPVWREPFPCAFSTKSNILSQS